MRLLLDTCTLIWHYENSPSLSMAAKTAVNSTNNRIVISVATLWEMSIKVARGKLSLGASVAEIISRYETQGAAILPVCENHALGIGSLPDIHCDPFDRMLVSQARCERLTLVTDDTNIMQYPVDLLW